MSNLECQNSKVGRMSSVKENESEIEISEPFKMLEIQNPSISQEESDSKSDFYQILKACLNCPNSTYKDKVYALSKAWETFSASSMQYSEVIPFLYNDTIMIVLQFEWGKLRKSCKNHLNTILQNAASNLVSSNTHAYHLCLRSLRIVNNPWNYPIVTKITNGTSISESEGCDFFLTEMPILMNARLDRICWDDKCKDLALKLVAFYRKCFQDSKNMLEPYCSVVCRQMWLDLHVTLLYICNETVDEIVNLLEKHFSEGLDIVKRLVGRTSQSHAPSKRSSGINRIWREHGMETAEFTSQWLLSTAFIKCPPPKCLASLVIQYVNLQKKLGKSSLDIIKNLHALLDKDQLKKLMTSAHMYVFCATLFDKFGDDFKSFCIEYYVKAVIVDLNYLEKQKWDPKTGGVKSDEIGLAAVFSKLAELVRVDIRICKEMALAAFSLHPTKERFDKLVELAAADQAVKRKSPSPIRKEPLPLIAKNVEVSNEMEEIKLVSTVSQEEENKSPYTDLAAATLGLSEGIIQELGVIVDGVRWEVLTWNIGWKQLEPLCRRYLNDKETMRSVTNELNFLKIDYSQFKDMPRPARDAFWGIEKGYENCLEPAVAVHKKKSPSLKTDPRRSKSKKSSSRKKGSRNSPSDMRSKRNQVLKGKTWMRRTTLSLKSSSESDKSIDLNNSKTSSEVVPDGVKRSARIQASKRTSTELTRDSASLVKRLREIRLDFGGTSKWQDPSPKAPTTKTQQSRKLSSYRLVANHFAPMLSTLNMQPKVVLTRTTINSTTNFIQNPSSRNKMLSEASGYCHPWIPIEHSIKKEYLGVEKTKRKSVTGVISFDNSQASPIPAVQLHNQRRSIKIRNGNENSNNVCEKGKLVEDNKLSILSSLFTTDGLQKSVESNAGPSIDRVNCLGKNLDLDGLSSTPLPLIHQISHHSESDASSAVLKPDLAFASCSASGMRKKSRIHESVACTDSVLSVIEPSSHIPHVEDIQERSTAQSQLDAEPNGSTITSLSKRVRGVPAMSSSPGGGDGMAASNISVSSISSLSSDANSPYRVSY